MKLAVLGTATDNAVVTEYRERERFANLRANLADLGVRIDTALNLLGRYDYLFVMSLPDDTDVAFRAMSTIAQSGMMRTESFIAMPLSDYFNIAASIGGHHASITAQ